MRASDLSKDWNGIEITSKYFYLIDGTIPFVKEIEKDFHKASAFLKWLEEDPSILTRNRKQSIVYIPHGSGNIQSIRIESSMSWVDDLIEENWIPANDGKCYNPKDVLLQEDIAQPDIPYTKVSENLREVLHEIDIPFGENIPTVRSLQRLKIEGPSSDRKRLFELVIDVINELKDDPKSLKELEIIALNENLFPVPGNKRTPDGLVRIPLSRIVLNTGSGRLRRSDLSGWVISMKDFESDPELHSIINRIYTLIQVDIPKTTMFTHAVSFLEWVWKTKPHADDIRSYLPPAYDYIVKDIQISDNERYWSEVLDNAMVFTSKREWSPVKNVFYDDIGKASILRLIANLELEIATSGHLGNNQISIKKVSELLNLQPLSERIAIRPTYSDSNAIETQASWQSNILELISLVRNFITTQGAGENDEKYQGVGQISFKRVQEIKRKVYDQNILIYENQVNSDFIKDENRIVVKGKVTDFAGDLCEIIVDILGLSQRGDLVAKISPLLFTLDNDRSFYQYFKKLREFCGFFETDNEFEMHDESFGAENSSKEVGTAKYFEEEETQIDNRSGEEIKSNSVEPNLKQNIGYSENNSLKTPKDKEEKPNGVLDNEHEIEPINHGQINRKKHQKKGQSKKRIDRIVTYVYPRQDFEKTTVNQGTNIDSERITRIGNAAEKHVLQIEKEDGRKPKLMPINHPGYDIESYGNREDDIRYIEVKGIDGEWTDVGVGISSRQYEEALSKGDSYWLYVIENALSDKAIVHRLNNPVAAISNYRFDSNWKMIAAASWPRFEDSSHEKLIEGSRVLMDNKLGTIIEVLKFGKLDKIEIRFDDGEFKIVLDKTRINLVEQE